MGLSPPVKVFLLTVPRGCLFCGAFLLIMLHVGVCCAVVSVPCSLVVACLEGLASWLLCLLCFLSLSQICSGPQQNKGEVGAVKTF